MLAEKQIRRDYRYDALRDITLAVSSTLELDKVLNVLMEKINVHLSYPAVLVWLANKKSGLLERVACWNIDEQQWKGRKLSGTPALVKAAVESKQPVAVGNVHADPRTLDRDFYRRHGLVSYLGVPLLVKDKVLGVLVFLTREEHHFETEEIDFLSTLAGQAAMAIHNSQLYQRIKKQKSKLEVMNETNRQNLARIRALREIDLAITSTLDLPTVLDNLLEKIDLFLPYASVTTIRLFNKKTGQLEFITCRNIAVDEMNAYSKKAKRGLTDVVFESKAPLVIADVQTDPRARDSSFFLRHGLVSYLGVPLIAKGQVLGVLSFVTREKHDFTSQEIHFLQTLGGQAAIAIYNSQLYEQIKNQAAELERANKNLKRQQEIQQLLKELSQDIIFLDYDKLLEKLTNNARRLLQADIADVRLLDEEIWQLRGLSGVQPDQLPPSWRSSSSSKQRSTWIREHRQPLMIPDIRKGPVQSIGKVLESLGIRGFLGVPVLSRQGEVIGILRVLTYAARQFSDYEVDLLQQLANGAAVALENTRLLEETRDQALVLEKANKVKDEFLSIVSHELRTPVATVIGYTQMIREGMAGEINQEQARVLAKIGKNSSELLTIINSIMEATKIEAGLAQVEKQPVELGNFMDELKSSYDLCADKKIALGWNYPAELPTVHTDGDKLKHVLQNLISNAIKYTDPGGTVTVSVRCIREKQLAEFKVADTGIGIAEDQLSSIFEMFRQVDSSRTRSHGGVGLGLYIVKKFTELLRGEIQVESELGKGSTFTVTVPC